MIHKNQKTINQLFLTYVGAHLCLHQYHYLLYQFLSLLCTHHQKAPLSHPQICLLPHHCSQPPYQHLNINVCSAFGA